jgi:hypothetical protein
MTRQSAIKYQACIKIFPNSLRRILKFIIALCIFPASVLSQNDFTDVLTFIDSNITRNFVNTYFDNNINSARLISKINLYTTHNKFDFYLKNYYSSAVTKLTENLFRDFDNVRTGIGYDLTENINVSANYGGQFFSDDKTFQIKGTSSNLAYLSGTYNGLYKGSEIYSVLNAGYKHEDQIGEFNKGPSFSGEFDIYNLNVSDFLVDGQLRLGYESLDPRRNTLVFTRLYFERASEDNIARNEFDGSISRIRKDFYFPADVVSKAQYGINNNIEKRIETIYRFFDRFDYLVSKNFSVVATINPNYRDITKENYYIPVTPTQQPSIYDTDIQELSVNGDIALNFNIDKVDYQLKAFYRERDEKHFLINPNRINSNFVDIIENNESQKNNHSSLFLLNSNLYYNLNVSNRLELIGSASILKYDTPSEENFDDRDELGYLIYLAHRFNNLRNLLLITSVDLSLYHTVYIFSQRSANNNWNRVLRFTSRSYFTPADWFRNVGVFNVLANYTIYDFEDLISTVKSYSFRQVNLKDSLIVNFTRHIGADVYAEIKLYERGELNWGAFSQRPINYFEDKIINPELNYFINNAVTLSAGYKYFEQRRYNYVEGERVFDTFIRTSGPFVGLKIEWKRNSRIEILGSYDYYRYGDETPPNENSSLYLNAVWNF